MSIGDRIEFHQKHKERWDLEKERLGTELNNANEKIIFHWAAIQNLLVKQRRVKKECLQERSGSNK